MLIENPVQIPVLNHGFIELQEYMGSDASIVSAARASYTNGTTVSRDDRTLLRYLYRHEHTSPFEMAEVRIRIRAPIFVIRQWVRHRTHNMNEESARYSVIKDLYYVPELKDIQPQSTSNRQGREGELTANERMEAQSRIYETSALAFEEYRELLDMDVSREIARMVLPVNTFSTFIWKMDLKNMLHLLKLRADSHTQFETRAYAEALLEILRPIFPVTIEAWEDYDRYSVKFSRMEMNYLRAVFEGMHTTVDRETGVQNKQLAEDFGMSLREVKELRAKLLGPDA